MRNKQKIKIVRETLILDKLMASYFKISRNSHVNNVPFQKVIFRWIRTSPIENPKANFLSFQVTRRFQNVCYEKNSKRTQRLIHEQLLGNARHTGKVVRAVVICCCCCCCRCCCRCCCCLQQKWKQVGPSRTPPTAPPGVELGARAETKDGFQISVENSTKLGMRPRVQLETQ